MNYARNGLRAFGLSLLGALGLMALVASGAPAAETWDQDGMEIPATRELTVSLHEESALLVGNLKILCLTVVSHDVLIFKNGDMQGELLLTNCKTFQGGVEQPACRPVEPIIKKFLSKVALHAGETVLLFTPSMGSTVFEVIEFKAPCLMMSPVHLKGSLLVECLKEANLGLHSCNEPQKAHLWRAINPQPAGHGLMYGGNAAVLDGVLKARLSAFPNSFWNVLHI
jgi:hypothetical protein